jgi:hypothetical protein
MNKPLAENVSPGSSQNRRISPASLANLQKGKRFQKGQTGNAGGRPSDKEFRQYLKDWLAEKVAGKERQRLIVERMAAKNPEFVFYYVYGKPADTLAISERNIELNKASRSDLEAEMLRRGIPTTTRN